MYHIFQTIRHTLPPKIWEENGGASYRLNVAYLAHRGGQWSGVTGGRSRVTTAGSWQRQEWGNAVGSGLGGGGVPAVRSKGVLGPESLLRHTIVLRRRVQVVKAC